MSLWYDYPQSPFELEVRLPDSRCIDALPRITTSLIAGDLCDDDIPAILRLQKLRKLIVFGYESDPDYYAFTCKLTAKGLKQLAQHPELESLSFAPVSRGDMHLTDEGLHWISKLRNLQSLSLPRIRHTDEISKAGFQRLFASKTLTELSLNYLDSPESIDYSAIRNLAQLRSLTICMGTWQEKVDFDFLRSLPSLEFLKVHDVRWDHNLFEHLRPAGENHSQLVTSNLKRLELSAVNIRDEDFNVIGCLLRLEALHINHATDLTDNGLLCIQALLEYHPVVQSSSFRELRLIGCTQITFKAIDSLRNRFPYLQVCVQ